MNKSPTIEKDLHLFKSIKLDVKRKIKNVVGVDLPFKKPRGVDLFLSNDGSKKEFLKKVNIINKFLMKNVIKIY